MTDTWYVSKGKRTDYSKQPVEPDKSTKLDRKKSELVKQPTNEVPTRECGWKPIKTKQVMEDL